MASMDDLPGLVEALRRARECEAAATLDVQDAKHAFDFAGRKLEATRARHTDVQRDVAQAAKRLEDVIMDLTRSSLAAATDEWR